MNRPGALVGIVFEEDDDLVAFELFGGHDAVFGAGLEEDDGDHEGAGEVEGVILGEGEIVCHFLGLHLERANSR